MPDKQHAVRYPAVRYKGFLLLPKTVPDFTHADFSDVPVRLALMQRDPVVSYFFDFSIPVHNIVRHIYCILFHTISDDVLRSGRNAIQVQFYPFPFQIFKLRFQGIIIFVCLHEFSHLFRDQANSKRIRGMSCQKINPKTDYSFTDYDDNKNR